MLKNIIEDVAVQVGLNAGDMTQVCSYFDGEYHQVSFDCSALHYECFIEPSGEIVGFNCYPIPETRLSSVA